MHRSSNFLQWMTLLIVTSKEKKYTLSLFHLKDLIDCSSACSFHHAYQRENLLNPMRQSFWLSYIFYYFLNAQMRNNNRSPIKKDKVNNLPNSTICSTTSAENLAIMKPIQWPLQFNKRRTASRPKRNYIHVRIVCGCQRMMGFETNFHQRLTTQLFLFLSLLRDKQGSSINP